MKDKYLAHIKQKINSKTLGHVSVDDGLFILLDRLLEEQKRTNELLRQIAKDQTTEQPEKQAKKTFFEKIFQ